jgi:DNA-3-methyladenine glycosylase I
MKAPANGLAPGSDGRPRCFWSLATEEYQRYHDEEWGFPSGDDRRLYEKLCLEGFQAGLSWLTILRKREAFRRGFAGFDPAKVARFGEREIAALLGDAGIVRHRGKIESAINNARRAIAERGSLASYVWSFEPAAAERPKAMTLAALKKLTESPTSQALAKDLRRRGWTFVGPTTIYAFMQSVGIVNDHLEGCCVRAAAAACPRPPALGPTQTGTSA